MKEQITKTAELLQRESDYMLDLDWCTKIATLITKL